MTSIDYLWVQMLDYENISLVTKWGIPSKLIPNIGISKLGKIVANQYSWKVPSHNII